MRKDYKEAGHVSRQMKETERRQEEVRVVEEFNGCFVSSPSGNDKSYLVPAVEQISTCKDGARAVSYRSLPASACA